MPFVILFGVVLQGDDSYFFLEKDGILIMGG